MGEASSAIVAAEAAQPTREKREIKKAHRGVGPKTNCGRRSRRPLDGQIHQGQALVKNHVGSAAGIAWSAAGPSPTRRATTARLPAIDKKTAKRPVGGTAYQLKANESTGD